jgi:hypothetical protein
VREPTASGQVELSTGSDDDHAPGSSSPAPKVAVLRPRRG